MVSFNAIGPVKIEAEVKSIRPGTKREVGTYRLEWAAPDRFREEIHFGTANEVKVASGETLYVKRDANYTSLLLFCAEEVMNPAELVAFFARAEARTEASAAALDRNKGDIGAELSHGIVASGHGAMLFDGPDASEIWIDQKHGWPSWIALHRTSGEETIEYGRYRPEGSGFIAFHRQYLVSGNAIMEIDIKHLVRAPSFSAAAFDPPKGAEKLDWCSDEIPPQRLPLKPPLPVTADDFESPEILDAFVRADGTPSRLEILASGGPAEDAAIRKLANLIRFTPATCGGRAVASETPLAISAMDIAVAETVNIPMAGKDGYTNPQCIHCPDPEYSEEGYSERIQGELIMDVVIGVDGRVHNIRVIKGLGHGLDEEAIHAARDVWRFKPALGPNGKPAPVRMLIDINFHLY